MNRAILRETGKYFLSNGTLGHWLDQYMADATSDASPVPEALPIQERDCEIY